MFLAPNTPRLDPATKHVIWKAKHRLSGSEVSINRQNWTNNSHTWSTVKKILNINFDLNLV